MQCPTCLETTVTAFCRNCGKGVCRQCEQDVAGVAHCRDCVDEAVRRTETAATIEASEEEPADAQTLPPPPAPPRPSRARHTDDPDAPHPGIAGVLGLVPGLGAVYNGQYVKGVLHALLFGLAIAIAASTPIGPAFAPVVAVLYLYMPIEAYRTAQDLRRGEKVDEMSGLVGAIFQPKSGSPVGGVVVIAVGVLMLLFTLEVLDFREAIRYWPILIIVLGVWQIYRAIENRDPGEAP